MKGVKMNAEVRRNLLAAAVVVAGFCAAVWMLSGLLGILQDMAVRLLWQPSALVMVLIIVGMMLAYVIIDLVLVAMKRRAGPREV